MRVIIRRGVALLSAMSLMVGLSSVIVNAQNNANTNRVANGFRISPVRSELTIEKGKSQNIDITVENPTDVPTVAKALINDFVASENESGQPRLILDEKGEKPKNSLKTLLQPIDDVSLAAKQKKTIAVTLKVPDNASAGGYYGAIRFVPSDIGKVSNVGLTASVGTLILVRVPGNLTERLDLLQFSAAQNEKSKHFITSGDVSVMTRLKNTGDIHVKPFGKVIVKDTFGKVINEFEFNNTDPKANILPDSTRKFIDPLPKRKWFGRYTVEANLGYSQGSGNLISAKTTFWYMPPWSLAVLAVIILGIAGAIYWLLRKRDARVQHRSKRS
jgi:hypothetical protein